MNFDPWAAMRYVFCHLFCPCKPESQRREAVVRLRCGLFSITICTVKGKIMATVPATGGPFQATITNFVDSAGNPTTESDVPVWASSDDTIASVLADVVNPQAAEVTLTGKTGQVQITASFPDASGGGTGAAYVVTGMLDVLPGEAVSASMEFSGPGV